ncbi:hypothetical protein GCM10027447_12710 [Glycomyces halotolerans]
MGLQGWLSTCPASGGLRSYGSRKAARGPRRALAREHSARLSQLQIRRCPYCRLWHVRWRLGGGR